MNPDQINQHLSTLTIPQKLKWVWDKYAPSIVMTSSFQTQSVPLLHMVAQTIPDLPIIFLDTGFHFPQTLLFRDTLMERYGLNVVNVKTEMGHQNFKSTYGNLYLTDPDLCCHINKTAPLQKKLNEYKAWITGVRGDQTETRSKMETFSITEEGTLKICPLLNWTKKDLWRYHNKHDLPMHPLFAEGYMSIGCSPCTRPATDPNDERSGRWAEQCKTECGIHKKGGT